jgi:hypothetical protein
MNLNIQPTEIAVTKVAKTKVKAAPAVKIPKEKFNALMPKDLLDRAKNISFFTPNVSLTDLVVEGLTAVVERYEEENGGKFDVRTGNLKKGRKPKVVLEETETETETEEPQKTVAPQVKEPDDEPIEVEVELPSL